MAYHWNWGIFLDPVSTGEPTTYLGWMWAGLQMTVALSLAAWTVALIVGSLFGILRTVPNRALAGAGTVYVAVFRNVPLIVQFFIWFYAVPELLPTSWGHWWKADVSHDVQVFAAGVTCLGLFTGARVCEQVRSGIAALPPGQRGAGLALGLTLPQVYRFVLLPNAYRVIVPPLTSEFLNVFKNSAVASVVGMLELSAQARQLVDYTAQTYESFIVVTAAYFVINLVVMRLMRGVERRTRLPGHAGAR